MVEFVQRLAVPKDTSVPADLATKDPTVKQVRLTEPHLSIVDQPG